MFLVGFVYYCTRLGFNYPNGKESCCEDKAKKRQQPKNGNGENGLYQNDTTHAQVKTCQHHVYPFQQLTASTLCSRREFHLMNTRWPHWYKYVFSRTLTVRALCSHTEAPQLREKTDCSLHDTLNTIICSETTQTSSSEVLLISNPPSLPPLQPGASPRPQT